ncbi:exonuclease domain-containing protein [Anatilimnocola sp. NA78]|uniref:exonuclease domain-containing protein n=1 Tax=Anatilimnocola sp. NA78 TaxID=3415683 RepID=UPI003CE56B40
MAKLFDQVLIVDIESTCWQGYPPAGQISEIIEVGLCPVDVKKLERLEKRSLLIKPIRSKISEFCTKLTTLTDEHFRTAGTLADAVGILKKEYRSPDRLWASWGDYDRRQFERVCKELTVPYPFGVGHLNIKTLFAVAYGDSGELGLDEACERIGMKLEGTHHRGHDDAWNIAGIFCHLLQKFRLGSSLNA